MPYADPGVEEKRQYKRVEDSFPLKLSVRAPYALRMQLGPEVDAVAGDISAGGLGIYANAEMPSDTMIDVSFKIINDRASISSERQRYFELPGRVCYSIRMPDGGCRLGVSFLNISREDADFIKNYVGSRAS